MTGKNAMNNLVYYLFCGFSGAIIGGIVWLFLKLMNVGIEFIWQWIPQKMEFEYYPLVVCTIGGILLGIFQEITYVVPDELETVMAKVKKDKSYPYNKVILLCAAALIPLLFGGSIGPEAGLTGVIVGLCYWAGNHMKYAKNKIPELMEIGVSATLGAIFYAPLFALVAPAEERLDSTEKQGSIHSPKIVSNIIAVLFSLGTMYTLKYFFGGVLGLPRIGEYDITNSERIWGIPLAIVGAALGLLFVLFEKAASTLFTRIQNKAGIIVSTTLSGILLGVVGTYLPMVMFSGEENITVLQGTYASFAPWLLIATGVIKLLMTNICIKSGWKGGHFFPVIFCGISIGFGVAMLFGLDMAFCAAVITAGILGSTMKKPIAVTLLLLLCFDVRIIPWIIFAAFVGSIVPFGKKKNKAANVK